MHHNTRCMHACMHACPSSFVPVFPFAVTLRATWQVEMLRKLILTVALAALYKGEPPQLGGSLFAIFCFYSGHLLLKPYLNQGLNVFQRTSGSPFLRVCQRPLSSLCQGTARVIAPAVVASH